jgi:hypothetical protein
LMKAFKFGLVVMAAALITFGLAGPSYALHDGGVAHCDACHTMHNSQDGEVVIGTGGAHLQIGADPSSTCLRCHAGYGQFSDGSAYRSGGDFYWVTKDFSWSAHGRTSTSTGDSHGHNIIALDETGLDADATLTTAPGGTYQASALGCNSCHDPHGKQGNELLLYGIEATAANYPGGAFVFTNDAPDLDAAGRRANVTDESHSAYKSGMSEWCSNCHTDFDNITAALGKHPAGNTTGGLGAIATNYNAYVQTGDITGNAATSYLEIVPFEEDVVTNTKQSTQGPTAAANVMCLTCHRSHASAFPDMGRWYFVDTLMLEDSHPMAGDTGATGSDVENKWYSRVVPADQRSYCNKCHVQD